jgi:hypothetical protein
MGVVAAAIADLPLLLPFLLGQLLVTLQVALVWEGYESDHLYIPPLRTVAVK